MKQRFTKFFMIIPPFTGNVGSKSMVDVGIGSILEYLHNKGVTYAFYDMRVNNSKQDLYTQIRKFKPDLIGFKLMTYKIDITFQIIKDIKKTFKTKIVVGGPHLSSERKHVFSDCPVVDYGIKIEGEETLHDLIKGVPLKDIKGLIYKQSGKIIENSDREFIKNLDSLPLPTYKDFEMEKYDKVIPLFTSRGCPFQCTFCTIKLTMGRAFRYRTPESLVKEVLHWRKKGYKSFQVLDDNFTLLPDRVIKFCDLLYPLAKDLNFRLPNGVRADKVNEEVLRKLKKVGFNALAIAVESANDSILKAVKKGEKLKDIEKAIKLATKIGFDVELFFIVGLPYETEADIRRSFKFALKYPVSEAKFYNLIPFKYTELHTWITENGKFHDNIDRMLIRHAHFSPTPFFETKELSFKKRKQLLKEGVAVQKKTLKRNMTRKFKKLGILAPVITEILYFKPIHSSIEIIFQIRFLRKLIKWFINVFKLGIKNF